MGKSNRHRSLASQPDIDPDIEPPLGSMPTTSSASYAAHSPLLTAFDRFASGVTRWAGSPLAFCGALPVVLVWAVSGPVFKFSEEWSGGCHS